MTRNELAIPPHFAPDKVGEVWRVPYQQRAEEAEQWAKQHHIPPAADDRFRICVLPVDVQNTFCIPGFELYVGGRSGRGALDDNLRFTRFIYRNLHRITQICPTLDTHQATQIFHGIFLVNDKGEHPAPYTLISEDDILRGAWKFNPSLAKTLGITDSWGQRHLQHYVRRLKESGRYDLTVWPYHAMLGGIGYALVSSIEEALFFHNMARCSQTHFEIKGYNPFTENYSVLGPEVQEDGEGKPIAKKNTDLIQKLLQFDGVIVAGQAKSHCVAWTIDDLLRDILVRDKRLAEKVYLLEDCTSPVVVPGVIDYTHAADASFHRFSQAGMHVVRSTDPMESWPGILL